MALVSEMEYGRDHEFYDIESVGNIDSEEASPKFFKWNIWA